MFHAREIIVYLRLILFVGTVFLPVPSIGQKSIHIDEIKDTSFFFMIDRCQFAFSPDTGIYNDTADLAQLKWFTTDRDRYQNFGRPKTKLLMRFSVSNPTDQERELSFVFGNHTINEIRLYQQIDSGLQHLHTTGSGYPFSSRPYPFFVYAFPLHFEPNETKDYIVSIDAKGELMMFIPMMFHPRDLKSQNDKSYFSLGILSGIILICGIFNLFLFILVREKLHLLYFLYALVTIWCLLSMVTMDFQFVFPDAPQLIYPSRFASNFLYFTFLLLIMQLFLGQKPENSKMYWPVKAMISINLLFFALEWLVGLPRWPAGWSDIHYTALRTIHACNFLIIIWSCVEKITQRQRLAWLFFSAILILVIGGILTLINTLGWLDWHTILMPPSPVAVGLVIEAMIICFGILYRYHLLKKEKEQLSLELQDQKLSVAKEILRVEEAEKKRFAQNLHDELGGNLAALKVAIQQLNMEKPIAAQISELLNRTADATRTIAHDIMPPEFEETDLDELLNGYYNRLSATSGIHFNFWSDKTSRFFTKHQELVIYRILLELSSNIMRHSKATAATIQMITYDDHLEIMVEDNGIGFDTYSLQKGMGLHNIESRIKYFHGSFVIDSAERGTTIIITLPIQVP